MRDRDKLTTPVAAPTGRWRALAARCLNPGGTTLSSRLRNALFVLFLGGILAYGAGFAWYILARLDLINLIRGLSSDDAFYYFQIAHNLAEGKFSTFDGGITRTNGYHPLWLFLITPFYWIFDKEAALFAIKAFEIMLIAGGVALVTAAAWLARLPWYLMFAALPDCGAAERVMRTNHVGRALLMGALAEGLERRGGVLVGVNSVTGERRRAANYFWLFFLLACGVCPCRIRGVPPGAGRGGSSPPGRSHRAEPDGSRGGGPCER